MAIKGDQAVAIAGLAVQLTHELARQKARADRAEARVRELEAEVSRLRDRASDGYSTGQPCPRGNVDGGWDGQ